MSSNRAEYLRQYRAARRAERPVRPDHVCEGCGQTFGSQRTDARFCSEACRAARWRPINHHAVLEYRGTKELCSRQVNAPSGPFALCDAPAKYRHESMRNRDRVLNYEYLCAEHAAEHITDDTTIGEPIFAVIERHGREDRARHGTPQP
jgi:hypothetical protein